jgi:hypothetical protein
MIRLCDIHIQYMHMCVCTIRLRDHPSQSLTIALIGNTSCFYHKGTTSHYYFRPDPKMRKRPPFIDLEIVRGKRPTWKVYEFDSKMLRRIAKNRRPGTARGVMALEEEVSQWFQWNKSLRVVYLHFYLKDRNDVN